MIDDPTVPKAGKHRDLEPNQIRKSEEAVQKVLTAISHFTNPWRIPDKDKLYSLASGAPVPPEIEADVLRADELGETLKRDFIFRLWPYHYLILQTINNTISHPVSILIC